MTESNPSGVLHHALGLVARAGLWLSVGLLVAIAALVSGQVLMRNVFSVGLPWTDELARWFGIGLVFLTLPYLLDRGVLIAVEFLPDRLTGRARTLVLAIAELSIAVFSGISLYAFVSFLERAARFKTPALGLPNLIFYMPALIGVALLGIIAVLRLTSLLRRGTQP